MTAELGFEGRQLSNKPDRKANSPVDQFNFKAGVPERAGVMPTLAAQAAVLIMDFIMLLPEFR